MKKSLLLFLCCWCCTHAWCQINNQISIGHLDSVHSAVLNENREIWVHVPNNGNSIYQQTRYPVIYLLDGDAHFTSVTGIVEQLSTINGNALLPQMIVVGILNTNRTRDLTPTHSLRGPDGKDQPAFEASGGGEAFTRFMEKELIPYVDAHYPTTSYRVLIGHSFGGLFVLNTFAHHPGLFNAYVSIDPSLWWDRHALLRELTSSWGDADRNGKRLYVSAANTMPPGTRYEQVKGDTSSLTDHLRSILTFTSYADAHPGGVYYAWHYYPSDDHGSVPLISEYDGLRFLFDFYKLPNLNPDNFTIEEVVAHYKKASDVFGYPVLPPEQLVNEAGYHWLQRENYDEAYRYFRMNIDNYPQSFNVYDSMGDYYSQHQEPSRAAEMYTRALSIREFPETREKLNKVKRK